MLLTKEVEIKPSGKSLQYYRDLGYDAKWHEPLMVRVEDLPNNSNKRVYVGCDICGGKTNTTYQHYAKSVENYGYYTCKHCNQIKVVETTKRLYGTEYYTQTQEYKERAKDTCNLKYGKEYPSQVPEIREKIKETLMRHYNVDNPTKSEEVRNTVKKTVRERYGVDSVSQLDFVKDKQKRSMRKKFGVDYALQSEEGQRRREATCIERFGVPHAMQCDQIKEKAAKTYYANGSVATSKQQLFLHSLYGGELNYPISYYATDICFPSEKIVVEYDGGFHDGRVRLGQLTQDEFTHKEIVRSATIKNKGYKQIRIKSSKDLLPTDHILLQMLSEAKQYFSETAHSWMIFDIDSSRMINVENKDTNGISYSFGELRKIKDSDLPEIEQNNNNINLKGA